MSGGTGRLRMAPLTGYLAAEGFEAELRQELALAGVRVRARHGRLLLAEGAPLRPAWAQNIWHDPRHLPAPSIKRGAEALRGLQRNWALLSTAQHRRAALIAAQLPHVSARPLVFPEPPPGAPLGGWSLIAPDTILASPTTESPFPHGAALFEENREGPPSRAYLKLWEALTRIGTRPGPGERCLDAGAAPGGWSWVLHGLGADVVAVDKAPLDPEVAALPRVDFRRASAFGLRPRQLGEVDWLFCDVVCYPAKLLAFVQRWLEAGGARNLVCTIKFQGATDFETQAAFAAIPGSRLMHLHHNKHELTWVSLASERERA